MITVYEPTNKLKNYILHYFVIDWKTKSTKKDFKQLCLPTGCSFIGFHIKGRMQVAIDNYSIRTNQNYVNAQTTRPYYMIADNDLYIIVICLKPTALHHLFNVDVSPMVNEQGNIYSLFGDKINVLEKELKKTKSTKKQIQLIEKILIEQQNKSMTKPNFIDIAIDLIIKNEGCISISELIRKIGVSERYFQKKFKEMVGIKPSIYINIVRFNFIFSRLREYELQNSKTLASLFDFYDAAHYSKSFKAIFGKSPSDFDVNKHPFLKYTAVENSLWLYPFQQISSKEKIV